MMRHAISGRSYLVCEQIMISVDQKNFDNNAQSRALFKDLRYDDVILVQTIENSRRTKFSATSLWRRLEQRCRSGMWIVDSLKTTSMSDPPIACIPSWYLTSHLGQVSLVISLQVRAMSTSGHAHHYGRNGEF